MLRQGTSSRQPSGFEDPPPRLLGSGTPLALDALTEAFGPGAIYVNRDMQPGTAHFKSWPSGKFSTIEAEEEICDEVRCACSSGERAFGGGERYAYLKRGSTLCT